MTYEEKVIEDCMKELIKGFRDKKGYGNNEYRICKNKIDYWKFILLKLYQEGFKQGVYTRK